LILFKCIYLFKTMTLNLIMQIAYKRIEQLVY